MANIAPKNARTVGLFLLPCIIHSNTIAYNGVMDVNVKTKPNAIRNEDQLVNAGVKNVTNKTPQDTCK